MAAILPPNRLSLLSAVFGAAGLALLIFYCMLSSTLRNESSSLTSTNANTGIRAHLRLDHTALWANHSIPYELWQTTRSVDPLHRRAAAARTSWLDLNPKLLLHLQDDADAEFFISKYFSDSVLQMYRSYPLGVMKADFWRYAAIYVHGGIYADIDTRCLRPIQKWTEFRNETDVGSPPGMPDSYQGNFTTCKMIIGMEYDWHFCQWVFAAVPGHPVLQSVLDVVLERAVDGFNRSQPHFVHHYTGPDVFTAGIGRILGLPGLNASAIVTKVFNDPTIRERADSLGMCVYRYPFFNWLNVKNEYASWAYKGNAWNSWLTEGKKLIRSRVP